METRILTPPVLGGLQTPTRSGRSVKTCEVSRHSWQVRDIAAGRNGWLGLAEGVPTDVRARDPDGLTTSKIREGLANANNLFDNVKTPAEAVLDSNYLMLTGELALQQARKLKVGGDYFDTDDFLLRLKTVITGGGAGRAGPAAANGTTPRRSQVSQNRRRNTSDDEEELEAPAQDVSIGWNKIGYLATKYTLRLPAIDFMLVRIIGAADNERC